jgi:hypothetical protein
MFNYRVATCIEKGPPLKKRQVLEKPGDMLFTQSLSAMRKK